MIQRSALVELEKLLMIWHWKSRKVYRARQLIIIIIDHNMIWHWKDWEVYRARHLIIIIDPQQETMVQIQILLM